MPRFTSTPLDPPTVGKWAALLLFGLEAVSNIDPTAFGFA